MPLAEVSKHFTGVVLELTPRADFKPRVERQSISLRQLLGHVTGLRRSLLQIFTLALALLPLHNINCRGLRADKVGRG